MQVKPQTPSQAENGYKATISDHIPNTQFPFRVFYYAPGMGFETGQSVYYGWNEWRTKEQAQQAAKEWEARNE